MQRIEQTINGREYLIEVSSVGLDKWRAQIARVPGGSTATMPFYGKTPDEAAGHLTGWLEILHGRPRGAGSAGLKANPQQADVKIGTTEPAGN